MGLTAAEKRLLSEINQKLDRLINYLTPTTAQVDSMEAAVLATGGVEALKKHIKAESDKRAAAYTEGRINHA